MFKRTLKHTLLTLGLTACGSEATNPDAALANGLGTLMEAPDFCMAMASQLAAATRPDHTVHLLSTLTALDAVEELAEAASLPPDEVRVLATRMEVFAMGAAWSCDAPKGLIVSSVGAEENDPPHVARVGDAADLDPTAVPTDPTLVLQQAEHFDSSGAEPPPAVIKAENHAGVYVKRITLNDTHEGMFWGAPEIEVIVLDPDSGQNVVCAHEGAVAPFQFDMEENEWNGEFLLAPESLLVPGKAYGILVNEDDDTRCVYKGDVGAIQRALEWSKNIGAGGLIVKNFGLADIGPILKTAEEVISFIPQIINIAKKVASLFKSDDDFIGIVAATQGINLNGDTTALIVGPGGDVVGEMVLGYKIYCQGQLVDAANCTPVCGDGFVDPGEPCDGLSPTCDADCTPTECGDGTVNPLAGEACDDRGESAGCNADCQLSVCGDGVVNSSAGEACDDGNTDEYDGCTAACIAKQYDSQCSEAYAMLAEDDRSVTLDGGQDGFCDAEGSSASPGWSGPGWYRFAGLDSLRMPESVPPVGACNTDAQGWLDGVHPADDEGVVTRTVCFRWGTEECQWSTDIDVVNCGDFFLYNLPETPVCNLRYCGE